MALSLIQPTLFSNKYSFLKNKIFITIITMIEIKKILNDFSSRVTFQCFPKIFQTNNLLLQVIWTLVFLLFSMVTSGLVIKSLLEYFEYQVITQIKIVHEIPTEFPTVTICDANPFTTKDA